MNQEQDQGPLSDLNRRRKSYQSWWLKKREPKRIDDVIARLVQRRGYAEVQQAGQLSEAWAAAAGPNLAEITAPGRLRRGVLEVNAADSLTMQELTFLKEEILSKIHTALPDAGVKDLRFRVGPVG